MATLNYYCRNFYFLRVSTLNSTVSISELVQVVFRNSGKLNENTWYTLMVLHNYYAAKIIPIQIFNADMFRIDYFNCFIQN